MLFYALVMIYEMLCCIILAKSVLKITVMRNGYRRSPTCEPQLAGLFTCDDIGADCSIHRFSIDKFPLMFVSLFKNPFWDNSR